MFSPKKSLVFHLELLMLSSFHFGAIFAFAIRYFSSLILVSLNLCSGPLQTLLRSSFYLLRYISSEDKAIVTMCYMI